MGIKCRCKCIADALHAIFNGVERPGRKGPHGSLHHAVIRDHIGGLSRIDLRDRNHRGINRLGLARDQALEGLNQVAGNQHRIGAQMGHGGMRTLAPHRDLEFVTGGHHGARIQSKLAHLQPRPVVNGKHCLYWKAIKKPIIYHGLGATTTFFGGLKNKCHAASKIPIHRHRFGGRQQHRRVAIMAAGMHLASVPACMIKGIELRHRQRIHVSPQPYPTVRRPAAL
jgi:hypothetical protein